jgi:hypothetical protein
MENQPQTKKNKRMLLYIIILTVGGLVIFGITLFYFLPIPQTVKNVAKETSIERCVYPTGIGYYSANSNPGAINTFYNRAGERICATGGAWGCI